MPTRVLCLDWDRRALRLVVAKTGGGDIQLLDAHAVRIPNSVDTADHEAFGAFIHQTCQRFRLRHRRVLVDVPRDRAVINRLKLPPTPANELAAAVRFQAMRELPFPLEEAEIDYVVMNRNDDGLATEVLLAAVRYETLENIKAICTAAGLIPGRVGLRPYANLISANHLPAMMDRAVLFVDVGPAVTEINVFKGRTLAFSRAANVAVPMPHADGGDEDSRVSSKAELSELDWADSLESEVVEALLLEAVRTVQAYRATDPEATLDQVVIAGGTGLEHPLSEALEERLNLPTTLFDPTPALGVGESESGKLRAFAAALGLAWGLSREGLLELDFLNPKRPIPPGQTAKRRLRIAGIAAAAAVVLLIGGVIWDRVRLNAEYEDVVARVNKLRTENLKHVRVDVRAQEALEWDHEARMGVWLDPLLDLTEAAVAPGKEMLISDLSVDLLSNEPSLGVKLMCSDWSKAQRFVEAVNAIEVDGVHPYRAVQGQWQVTKTVDERFTGKVDVEIELLELQKHKAGRKARETQRKDLLKGG